MGCYRSAHLMTIVPLTPPAISPMFIRTIAIVRVERRSHSRLVPSFLPNLQFLGFFSERPPYSPRNLHDRQQLNALKWMVGRCDRQEFLRRLFLVAAQEV
jgi:hypothetical protein